MAGDDESADEIATGKAGDDGDENARALIDILRSETGEPADRKSDQALDPAPHSSASPAEPPGDEAAIRAVIRAIPEKNQVVLGLVNIKEPVNRTSISLPADTTVRLGERLLLEALSLPQPPQTKIIKMVLARLLKALEKPKNG